MTRGVYVGAAFIPISLALCVWFLGVENVSRLRNKYEEAECDRVWHNFTHNKVCLTQNPQCAGDAAGLNRLDLCPEKERTTEPIVDVSAVDRLPRQCRTGIKGSCCAEYMRVLVPTDSTKPSKPQEEERCIRYGTPLRQLVCDYDVHLSYDIILDTPPTRRSAKEEDICAAFQDVDACWNRLRTQLKLSTTPCWWSSDDPKVYLYHPYTGLLVVSWIFFLLLGIISLAVLLMAICYKERGQPLNPIPSAPPYPHYHSFGDKS